MPRRALAEHRPFLLLSIIAAIAFYALGDSILPGMAQMLVKGAAVGMLALYALRRHGSGDARLLALVMLLAAIGDVAMELNYTVGGAVFFLSHCAAMALYLRHRRAHTTFSQGLFAAALLLLTPLIAWLLVAGNADALQIAIYALVVGGMAGLAWTSSFPRYRVGVGAVLFVLSDLLIFARMGIWPASPVPGLLIWPTYYIGQFLIATGVIQTLRHHHAAKPVEIRP